MLFRHYSISPPHALSGKFYPVMILATTQVSARLALLSRLENPVDATQFFSLTNQRSPLVGETSSATPLAKVEGGGAEFADLFKAQIQFQLRQEFAVPVEDRVELQVVPLGPTINLITANIPLPDMSSLASFARAQGLDEEAVKTLFGQDAVVELEKKPVESLQVPVSPLAVPQFDPLYLGATSVPLVQNTVVKSNVPAIASIDGKSALVNVSNVLVVAAIVNEKADVPFGVKTNSSNGSTIVARSEVFSVAERAPTLAAVDVLSGSKDINSKISVPSGVVVSLTQSLKVVDSTQIVAISTTDIRGEAGEVLRVRLEAPSEAVTQKLSDISGAKEALSWHALLASAALARSGKTELGVGTELLTMDVPPGLLADLEDGMSIDVPSPGSAPWVTSLGDSTRIQTPGSGSGDMTQNTSAEQRSEQYQQLADRLGQSVAQKLLAQIERGEWKLQLRLQPESLGRVDVALEMHSGGLDALFTAENGVTRELIAQGSAKLRDALTQSGMAVASVFVNGDQGRQSDGNPTSGQSFKGGSGAARDKEEEEESVAGVNVVKRQTYSVDGLDVLA
jgi:flagellar hook-length control protein FliK